VFTMGGNCMFFMVINVFYVFDAPPSSLIDLNVSQNVKIVKG
jgi:hypothetical protein